ncbi:MAG: hypothetical protein K9J37_21885 [Saprospiraceae bacterium]|nr:hypothetical protein [Saprospiraceae bacterium]MCF8252573.1 hypothetical protein [Saprospiraceae bacterium]MCF8314159.1 hypothetical protein [Saprospiraceae bacterium]MCF8442925.1 hypothetical protein [Saprospiraceae bacterium]
MGLRATFPTSPNRELGGNSDGYCYQSFFGGATLAHSFTMIKEFLKEEGYGDLPLPKDVEELKKFKLPTRNRQILMFEDNGYVHNPIKILFPSDPKKSKMLLLEIYDENAPNHLLRFHRKLWD